MRAVQITLLFIVAMLWLGAQAAQTEPNVPAVAGPTAQKVVASGAG